MKRANAGLIMRGLRLGFHWVESWRLFVRVSPRDGEEREYLIELWSVDRFSTYRPSPEFCVYVPWWQDAELETALRLLLDSQVVKNEDQCFVFDSATDKCCKV
jgi:hypothetical protein